ncbi:unnamed protein product [Effrenium voratum]|nr:unnamed protein product [Effrenium voratum]
MGPLAGSGRSGCRAWCAAVSALGSAPRLQGSCAEGGLQCLCEENGEVFASCEMICLTRSDGMQPEATATTTTTTTPAAASTGTTTAGVTTTTTTVVAAARMLLYDTRFQVGFMAQVEVFFVALELVSRLNQRIEDKCSGGDCQPWTLVLPPWCWVPRWYRGQRRAWSELFDVDGLRSTSVPFQEFQGQVDLGVVPVLGAGGAQLQDGFGDFLGYTKDMKVCDTQGQQLPQSGAAPRSVVYAGYCDSDIQVRSFKCGVLRGGMKALLNLVESTGKRSSSILVKHLDALNLHSPEGPMSIKFHPALAPAKALRDAAKRFKEIALGSLPYLGIHLRRNEFLATHQASTVCYDEGYDESAMSD